MNVSVFCFTDKGRSLAGKIAEYLDSRGDSTRIIRPGRDGAELSDACREAFTSSGALIFVGAAGIAVRAVSPFLKDKYTDPAVICCDETGEYVIPLLSGHVGGANRLAGKLAGHLGALPVITTATDRNRLFAVDVFAADQKLFLTDRKEATAVSASLLAGNSVGLYSALPVEGMIPEGLSFGVPGERNIFIGNHRDIGDAAKEGLPGQGRVLILEPRQIIAGIGCRRGTSSGKIRKLLMQELEKEELREDNLYAIATISQKAEEEGLIELANEYGIPVLSYPAEELDRLPGSFSDSAFVRETVGTGNVCERAAFLAARENTPEAAGKAPKLLTKKSARDGVTCALAMFYPVIHVEEKDS